MVKRDLVVVGNGMVGHKFLELELSRDRFAAAAFTSQIQARNLVTVAQRIGHRQALTAVLRYRVVVAAVGPTCARALEEPGIPAQVVPGTPEMGPMVNALAERPAHRGAR